MGSNAKIITYNMTDMYRKIVHYPTDTNGNIYYIPKPGASDLDKQELEAFKNAHYLKDTSKCYNSPTNIRRIWFGAKTTVVEFYAAPRLGVDRSGKDQKGGLTLVRNLNGNVDFRNVASQLQSLLALDQAQRKNAVNAKTMQGVEVTGSVFKSKGLYVFNNIEEIYFDWTALLSKDLEPLYYPILGASRLDIIQRYLNGGRFCNGIVESSLPLILFTGDPNKNTKINNSYLRLRRIVMISNLQAILDNYKDDIRAHIDTFDVNNPVTISTSWMDRADIRELIEKSNSDVMVSSINKTADNTSIDSFKIKSEVYTFDANVLSNKVKEYIGRLEKAKSENGYTAKLAKQQAEAEEEAKKKAAETKAPTAGSVFEFVNQLKQDYDSKIVEKALACACLAPLPPANAGQALAVALSDMGSADQLPYKNAYVKIEKDVNRNKTN